MIWYQGIWIKLFAEKIAMNKTDRPLTDEEKQKNPLPGEVSPKDAVVKAREFAAQEKAKLPKK